MAINTRTLPKTNKIPIALCLLFNFSIPSLERSDVIANLKARMARARQENVEGSTTKAVRRLLRLARGKEPRKLFDSLEDCPEVADPATYTLLGKHSIPTQLQRACYAGMAAHSCVHLVTIVTRTPQTISSIRRTIA